MRPGVRECRRGGSGYCLCQSLILTLRRTDILNINKKTRLMECSDGYLEYVKKVTVGAACDGEGSEARRRRRRRRRRTRKEVGEGEGERERTWKRA